ncbi:MAG: HAMP domain-containing sensor histidine kinase [Solirubrobacterales bacterium]
MSGGPRRTRSWTPATPLASVRNRLVLLFFAITTAAVGFVYLYVVPQLTSSLTAERLERLEQQGTEELDRLRDASARGLSQRELFELVRKSAADVDARVTLLGVRDGRPDFVIADSELEEEALDASYPAAVGAALSGEVRSGVETVRGRRVGETAFPVPEGTPGAAEWVVVLSTPLDDVSDNVALIRRQTLIAGAIALVAALIAAYLAASYHARRLRRLERAAERVAQGDFSVPIPVGSLDEVGQLALTLDEMQRRLRRLDSARSEFIANASHELRTPIASLGGFVELLDEEPEPDRESRREFVRTMRGQVDRLTKLSVDLLDLSRLDADAVSLRIEEFDPAGLAVEVAGEFAVAAKRHETAIEVETDASAGALALADRARSAQIMRILIDNAIKHTSSGTGITITSAATADTCRLSVADDGPGIDRASADRVFERFYTADSASGTGLGLAIGRELARLMDGDLDLETRRRHTVFTLTLPRASA